MAPDKRSPNQKSWPVISPRGSLSPQTYLDQVVSEFRERLMVGELNPGHRFSLRGEADSLGVSITPVRQAVSRLEAEGALEVLPKRLTRIPNMTLKHYRELTQIRIALEGFAVLRAVEAMTAHDLGAICEAEEAFRRECLVTTPDLLASRRQNKLLHFLVYRASAMPMLVTLIENLWMRTGPTHGRRIEADPDKLLASTLHACMDLHRQLVAALRDGDAERARAALVSDIQIGAQRIEAMWFGAKS